MTSFTDPHTLPPTPLREPLERFGSKKRYIGARGRPAGLGPGSPHMPGESPPIHDSGYVIFLGRPVMCALVATPDDSLAQAFLASCPHPARHKLARRDDLGDRLSAMVAAGAESHGGLGLPASAFVEHMASAVRPDDGSAVLDQLRAADLYLAWACAQGNAEAIRAFEDRYLDDIDDPDERQLARERLFVRAADDKPPRVANYDGRGPLRDWTRIVVARALADAQRRQESDAERQQRVNELAAVVSETLEQDPSLSHLQTELAAEIKRAIEESLAALTAQQRNLLRLRYLHGTSVEEMARLYNRHRVSMSRRLSKIQGDLLSRARRLLMTRLEVEPTDLEATVALVHSRLELTLDRLLRTEPPA